MLKLFNGLVAIAIVVISLSSAQLQAAEVKGLYRQTVPVANQTEAERDKAATAALQQVLMRASGQRQLGDAPAVVSALQNPERYIASFRYDAGPEDEDGQPTLQLQLSFAQHSIEGLLRSAQLPVWPANRPSVLVWLVTDEAITGRTMVNFADELDVVDELEAMAQEWGVPLRLPLTDLQDQLTLSPARLWQLDQKEITEASARYSSDAILVGRYSQTSTGLWLASWSLLHRGEQAVFDAQNQDRQRLFESGFAQVAQYLAGIYGIRAGSQPSQLLAAEVYGVEDFQRYIGLLDYLDGMAVLREAKLTAVEGRKVSLQLVPETTLDQVLDAIQLDKRLQPLEKTFGDGSPSVPSVPVLNQAPLGSDANPLRFRWPG